MKEQIIQILEKDRDDTKSTWKIRTVIQLWPHIPEEMNRLSRFINQDPNKQTSKSSPHSCRDCELFEQCTGDCAYNEHTPVTT